MCPLLLENCSLENRLTNNRNIGCAEEMICLIIKLNNKLYLRRNFLKQTEGSSQEN